jgi:hypothetical protein
MPSADRFRFAGCLIAVFYNKADGVYNYFNKERNEWCEYKREEIRLKQMKISTAAVSDPRRSDCNAPEIALT